MKIETVQGKNPTKIYRALAEIYNEKLQNRSTIFRWLMRFREDPESTKNNPKVGRTKTSTTNTNAVTIATLYNKG